METLTKYNINERNHPIMTVVVHGVSKHLMPQLGIMLIQHPNTFITGAYVPQTL